MIRPGVPKSVRKWRQKNRKRYNETCAKWRANNRERYNEICRKSNDKNKDERNRRKREAYLKKCDLKIQAAKSKRKYDETHREERRLYHKARYDSLKTLKILDDRLVPQPRD